MRAKPAAVVSFFALGAALLAAGACREPTHMLLELTTDVSCADRITSAIVIGTLAQISGSLEQRPAAQQTSACAQRGPGDAFVGTLTITPSGSDTDEVAIKVVAGIGVPPEQCTDPRDKRCIVARRVLRYRPHAQVRVPITLNDACRGVPCGVDETCSRGSCVSIRCEELGTCAAPGRDASPDPEGGTDADAPAPDARPPVDAGPADAGGPAAYTLVLGHAFTCALRRRDGAVFCWGDNTKGQIGLNPAGAIRVPTPVTLTGAAARVIELVAVEDRALARLANGEVWGWGNRASGDLGSGADGTIRPTMLWGDVAAVAAGRYTTCLKLTSGGVECHGSKADNARYAGPIEQHCAGATFLMARSSAGRVLGARWQVDAPNPVSDAGFALDGAPDLGLNAASVHCGDSFVFVRAADGGVAGWGNNSPYPLTDDVDAVEQRRVNLPSLGGFSALAPGIDHACGIKDGAVYCWGSGEFAAVDGARRGENRPRPVNVTFKPGLERAAMAAYAGGTHSCAVHSDDSVWCWGSNREGQLAQPTGSELGPTPITLPP